ncbi:CHRD domain-containing protein [Sphingomonas sp. AR_OL41]|uniref:CHRD domain-containing protein n=1 Tax=Sphingomonas sp. AR_OL41 TaxID=3042729 RepID=UPI0024815646|nr:CHRD domain-containing protein [Sphingomonas sp. AR_OL41]MDH7975270.1 CHRD domain-containing protein [Sphingomonas sp. AR_OL41]
MRLLTRMAATLCGLLATLATTSAAQAEHLRFRATLAGTAAPTATGSPATGRATIRVDTATQRVSVDLTITGLGVDALWDRLVKGPIGPIHFHEYVARAGQPDDVVLVLPLPYGPTYRPTRHGFRVRMKDYDYAAGAKLLGSTATFAHFVTALRDGHVILNVHTDRFTDGEISGTVAAS